MNAWTDSWFSRWLVGKKSALTSPGVTPCALLLFFILRDAQPDSPSLCQILQKFSSFLRPVLWAASPIRLHTGSREGVGNNVKVANSKSYSASIIVNLSAFDVRLALVLHQTWTVLTGYMVYMQWIIWYKETTLHELWYIAFLYAFKNQWFTNSIIWIKSI